MSEELPTFNKGDTVEGYRIMSEIGRGAASIIYLVQDPKTKQVWALKHVAKTNPKAQRFLDQAEIEYKIASQLNHESIRKIPKMIKTGSLLKSTGLLLVMELVDGISLHEEKPKTLAETIDVFRQTASALAQMHDRGFVHADMKPHNVIVGTDLDGKLTAKLIDLGQSCKIGTIKERIQGTPDYIAPEQVHRREITPKTDIYNLGATMYWVLTQHHIPTAIPKGESLVERLDDQFIERPKPANALNPRVPDALNELIMQCVEVDPNKRPLSMRDVIERMTQIRGTILAPDDSTVG